MKIIFTLISFICVIFCPAPAQSIISAKPSYSFSVYPNPAIDEISIAIDNPATEAKTDLYIYNAIGDLVYSKSITSAEFQVPVKIDLSGFQRGMYVVQLSGIDSKISRKLMLK